VVQSKINESGPEKATAKTKIQHSPISKKRRNADYCWERLLICSSTFTRLSWFHVIFKTIENMSHVPMQFNKKKISNAFMKICVLFSYQGKHFL